MTTTTPRPLETTRRELDVLRGQVEARIKRHEENFAPVVLADFHDQLRACDDERAQIKHCTKWLKMYAGRRR